MKPPFIPNFTEERTRTIYLHRRAPGLFANNLCGMNNDQGEDMASSSIAIQHIRDEIKRRRKELNLSPGTVVKRTICRMYDQKCDEQEYEKFDEDWLKRLEIGRPVSLSGSLLSALLYVLEYNDHERTGWLLQAGYSPIACDAPAVTETEKVINYVSYVLSHDSQATALINDAITQRQHDTLTDDELLEIVANSLKLVLKLRRQNKKKPE